VLWISGLSGLGLLWEFGESTRRFQSARTLFLNALGQITDKIKATGEFAAHGVQSAQVGLQFA
jgi:hypothetical protein